MLINREKVLYPELSYEICGLLYEIHNELGPERSEMSYADALEQKLKLKDVPYKRETSLPASFIGEGSRRNVPDFVIKGIIVIDLKAKRIVTKEDYFQMRRYLAVSGLKLGLIVNFRQKYLNPKRVLYS